MVGSVIDRLKSARRCFCPVCGRAYPRGSGRLGVVSGPETVLLARQWWAALSGTSYVPMSSEAVESLLAGLIDDLAAALVADPFDPAPGERAGAALVAARMTSPVVVSRSAEVLSRLPELAGGGGEVAGRLVRLLGAFGQGYAAALQKWTLAEQESIRRALLSAGRQAEQALRASEARFRVVFNNAAVAIAVGDTQGRLIDANPTLASMLGRTVDQLRGASVFDLFHPDDRAEIQQRVYEQLVRSGRGTVRLQERFERGDGSYGWTLLAVTLVPGTGNDDAYLLAVGEDVTERRRMEAELYRQARHDPLTGLPNRIQLREELELAIAAAGDGEHVGLCFVDLDGFKDVNDRYGHGTGDRVLVAVGARLRAAADGLLVARIGGDEFVAMIPAPADGDTAAAVAESLLAAVAEPLEVDGRTVSLSASIGVVVAALAGAQPDALLDAADIGLYRAKGHGRGQWVISGQDDATRYVVETSPQ